MTRTVLVLQHATWEGPGRIASALTGVGLVTVDLIADPTATLPELDELCGVVCMGGPMGAHDTHAHPGLLREIDLLGRAAQAGLPVLGVCLGGQLLARALGAQVHTGAASELGWAPVRVLDAADPLIGGLDGVSVLHWHNDAFDAPEGASVLAETDLWPTQAFRYRNAWAVQFHLEVDGPLLDEWLAVESVCAEADASLGAEVVRRGAAEHDAALGPAAARGLAAFAELVRAGLSSY